MRAIANTCKARARSVTEVVMSFLGIEAGD